VFGIKFENKTSERNWEMKILQLYWKEDIYKINLWRIRKHMIIATTIFEN